MSYNNLYTNLK